MKNMRIQSYDLFRGVLLIAMVAFHIIVNFTTLQFDQRLFYFVPAGFVLFLGVILACFLKNRFTKKLGLAAKLFFIFLFFNIPNFINKEFTVWDLIKGDQQIFSFEILLPMTMVILGTNLFDRLRVASKAWLGFLFFCLILLGILNYFQFYSYNLSFIIYGMIGYFAANTFDLNNFLQKFTNLRQPINVIYFFLFLVISLVPFLIIHFGNFYEPVIIVQIFALYLFFGVLLKNNVTFTILGKHSLFLYVLHIVVIKLLVVI